MRYRQVNALMRSSGCQQSARFAAAESVKPVHDTLIKAVSPGSNPGTDGAARCSAARSPVPNGWSSHLTDPTYQILLATGARSAPTRSSSGSNARFHQPPTEVACGQGRSGLLLLDRGGFCSPLAEGVGDLAGGCCGA